MELWRVASQTGVAMSSGHGMPYSQRCYGRLVILTYSGVILPGVAVPQVLSTEQPFKKLVRMVERADVAGSAPSLSIACCAGPDPPPDHAIPVIWHNFFPIFFYVPGRLDTVPSAHSRSLASVGSCH